MKNKNKKKTKEKKTKEKGGRDSYTNSELCSIASLPVLRLTHPLRSLIFLSAPLLALGPMGKSDITI